MAEPDSYNITPRPSSSLASPVPQNQASPSKSYSHFLYRAIFIVLLVAILPFFPSQAPDFINQTLITRSWELLHLLFVGIAVSYGLFSRRNVDTEKENPPKFDNAQTYVSKILQVSSVFDEDPESPSGSDENKIQTWNSQYFRDEPMVVEKSLLLPVRSLKSRVSNEEERDFDHEIDGFLGSGNGSGSGLTDSFNSPNKLGFLGSSSGLKDSFNSPNKLGSVGSDHGSGSGLKDSFNSPNRLRNGSGEIGGLDHVGFENKVKENVVLPSPIPWRSRSGRMEMKDEDGNEETDFDRLESVSFRSRSSRSNSSTNPSPKNLSPSPSRELRAKIVEDSGKKKGCYMSSPPPAPPPPPPISRKSINSTRIGDGFSSEKNDGMKSFKEEIKNVNRSGMLSSRDVGSGSFRSEVKLRRYTEGSSMGKSVRTIRANEEVRKSREIHDGGLEVNAGKMGTKKGFDQSSIGIDKQGREIPRTPQKYQKEKKELTEKIIGELEDSDSDDSYESSHGEEPTPTSSVDAGPGANEVDKKADEFIAKFREQIRLQRIASIKRSSRQRSSTDSR
ncbi:uncharacterized protein LOC143878238 isoform X3 [Tasmannia lanceolata]|uniref:uncharacterized protein LOC143878238 isoform X2 n=1 Tax=Tasmannia lanceolata TaxID=3420 RepID=UPI004062DACA